MKIPPSPLSLRKSDLHLVSTTLNEPFSNPPPPPPQCTCKLTQQELFSGPTYITFHTAHCPYTTSACTGYYMTLHRALLVSVPFLSGKDCFDLASVLNAVAHAITTSPLTTTIAHFLSARSGSHQCSDTCSTWW
jgi:hypothetical protein